MTATASQISGRFVLFPLPSESGLVHNGGTYPAAGMPGAGKERPGRFYAKHL